MKPLKSGTKVRIKSKQYFDRNFSGIGGYFELGSTIGPSPGLNLEMYNQANKVFTIRYVARPEADKVKISGKEILAYRYGLKETDWFWTEWMFDVIPNTDKNGNLLLEF